MSVLTENAPAVGAKLDFMSLVDDEDPDDIYELIDELAVGSYGSVYKSKHIPTGSIVAMKIMEPDEDEELNDFANEVAVLRDCAHPNIVNFVGAYKKGDEIFISMEYCDGGAANDIFKSIKEPMPEAEIQAITRESLKGLQYLHSLRIVHRDIKAANILLCSDGRCKLADFGVAALLANNPVGAYSFIGTPYWMAPEVIDNKSASINPYDMKSDIWSMGIVCLELAHVTPPLSDVHPMKALLQIPLNDPPTLNDPSRWSPHFAPFLTRCLVKTPNDRADADELLSHAWLVNGDSVAPIQALVRRVRGLPPLGDSDDEGDEDETPSQPGTPVPVPKPAALVGTPVGSPNGHSNGGAAPAAAGGGGDDDDEPSKPDFNISDDEADGEPTAKEVLQATVRKNTMARTNRPQKTLTAREEVALANQIRARKLLKKQMKEIAKLKRQHELSEASHAAQLAKEREQVIGQFVRKKQQIEASGAATEARLQKQLKADKDALDKTCLSDSKVASKKQKSEMKDLQKKFDAGAKSKQKELSNNLRKELKVKEEKLKLKLKEEAGNRSKSEIKAIEKQQRDTLAKLAQQRELETAQQLEVDKLAQEQDAQRKAEDVLQRRRYEFVHQLLNLELENHDQLMKSQTNTLIALNKIERQLVVAEQPMERAQLKATQERDRQQLIEMHRLEAEHLKNVIDEENRYQSRELTSKLRKEQKKYERKQKKERKKHGNISKRDWKKLCAEEDAKRAAKVKQRKAEFKKKREQDRVEQVKLQQRSQEHSLAQFKKRQEQQLAELKKKHSDALGSLDQTLLHTRIELLLQQHKVTSQLVLKQFQSKREAKQTINKEKSTLVQQQQMAMIELIKRHHAAMLAIYDESARGMLAKKQEAQLKQIEAHNNKLVAQLAAKTDSDDNKIAEAFIRLLDQIIANQKAELKALADEMVALGGRAPPLEVEAELVKELVAKQHRQHLEQQAKSRAGAAPRRASQDGRQAQGLRSSGDQRPTQAQVPRSPQQQQRAATQRAQPSHRQDGAPPAMPPDNVFNTQPRQQRAHPATPQQQQPPPQQEVVPPPPAASPDPPPPSRPPPDI